MKKVLKVLFASISAFILASCVAQPSSTKSSEKPSNLDSSIDASLVEESSLPLETYYHVTFLNDDEVTILYEVDVKEGEEAVYQGETPTKEEDDEFTYEFEGWSVDLTNIQSDVTAIAQYKATGKEGWGPIHWF